MDMEIRVLEEPIGISAAREFSKYWYEEFLKGSVDIEKKRVAIGGEYHIESCELLVQGGSEHKNVWGFNIRFDDDGPHIEFDSMLNLKPALGNRTRTITDEAVIQKAEKIIRSWIIF